MISSRTPEGDPNQCPICGHRVRLEPSIETRDAPCPNCGHLLWFGIAATDDQKTVSMRLLVLRIGFKRFGPPDRTVRDRLYRVPCAELDRVADRVLKAKDWDEFVPVEIGG
jgi:DNA-directed RNA polymerase subunit RPC12/RpoP